MIAYFFYIDGVGTIIKMAGAYGSDVGIGSTDLLIVLLVSQFVAFPCALIYGRLAKKFTGKRMIEVAIVFYILACFYAFQLDSEVSSGYWLYW